MTSNYERMKAAVSGRTTHGGRVDPVRIVHSCGHPTTSVQIANTHCPACVSRKRSEDRKARLDARRPKIRGRLPDKSNVHLYYHADERRWAGTLVIPGVGRFSASYPTQFGLCEQLDNKYREFLVDSGKQSR